MTAKKAASTELRRYTDIMSVIDMLVHKRVVLVSPRHWDDQNDAEFFKVYAQRKEIWGALALCLANSAETYHHWKIFAGSNAGACIVFNKLKFEKFIRTVRGIRYGKVRYHTNSAFMSMRPVATDSIPFYKRAAFSAEKEFRLIYDCDVYEQTTQDVAIDLEIVERIVLNPWAPRSVCLSVRSALRQIEGCDKISVLQSALINNGTWQSNVQEDDGVTIDEVL